MLKLVDLSISGWHWYRPNFETILRLHSDKLFRSCLTQIFDFSILRELGLYNFQLDTIAFLMSLDSCSNLL